MKAVWRIALRFAVVTLTLVIALLGGVMWLFGLTLAIQILFSGYALVVAGMLVVRMVGELRHGRFGVDILAVIAILATVLVGEYLASLIIVLMVSGGQALEDFAESRAQGELSALLAREPKVAR